MENSRILEIERLIKYFGGRRAEVARRLGVDNSYVTKYAKLGFIPAEMAVRIERMTGGEFKAINLAP